MISFGVRLAAAALGASVTVLACAPANAASANVGLGSAVTITSLPVGGTAIVCPARGAPVAAVELWYRAPSTGFGARPEPGIARLAAQTVAASKPIVGAALGRTVADVGGRLSITVYGDSVEVSALVPATNSRDVVKAMTTAYFAPVTSDDGFRLAQRDVGRDALFSSFDVESLVRDAVFGALFTNGPQHFSALGGPKSLAAISLADVRAFATRAFRSPNATLVVSGDVDPAVATAAATGRSEASAGGEAPTRGDVDAAPAAVTQASVLDSGGLGWIGPPIADEREATAMDFISDYLFRPDSGIVARQTAQRDPSEVVFGQFITLHDPGVLFVAYGGKQDAAVHDIVTSAVTSLQQPLSTDAFARARNAFEYHVLSDLQTPSQLAANFGWYAVEGNLRYAPGAGGEGGPYFKSAQSLTPQFVAEVARKFLSRTPAIVTLAPGASKASAP